MLQNDDNLEDFRKCFTFYQSNKVGAYGEGIE